MLKLDTIELFREVIDHAKPEQDLLGEGFMGRVKDAFSKEDVFDEEEWIRVLRITDVSGIVRIIETTDVDINEPVNIGGTLLYPLTAVMSDSYIVKILLDYEADPNKGADEYPEQRPAKPIIEGVYGNLSQSVNEMLLHGADPNLRFSYTGNGSVTDFSLLSLAALKGFTQVMQSLIEAGADPLVVDNDGRDALTYAVFGNSMGAVRVLKKEKAHLTMGKDQIGKSALDYAIEIGYDDIANTLHRGRIKR